MINYLCRYFYLLIWLLACCSPEQIHESKFFENKSLSSRTNYCGEPSIAFEQPCSNYFKDFIIPDINSMIEGFDYILLEPNLSKNDPNYQQRGFTNCDFGGLPNCCGIAVHPNYIHSDRSWQELIIDKLKDPFKNIRYIFLKPGDYRSLGPLCLYNRNLSQPDTYDCSKDFKGTFNVTKPNLLITFYNPNSANPFEPSKSCGSVQLCKQVIFENINLFNSSNIIVQGLLFDGVYPRVTGANRTNYIAYSSNNCVYTNCIFQNFFKNAIEIRSCINSTIQKCIFRNVSACSEDLCSDPVAIVINSDHSTSGDDCSRLYGPLVNCKYTMLINNIFYNIGQSFQSIYGGINVPASVYNSGGMLTPCQQKALDNECLLSGIDGSIFCGNLSYRSQQRYKKFENHFTLKIGSQNSLDPVIFKYNYCELACPIIDQAISNCPDMSGIGGAGMGLDIERYSRNIIVYKNEFRNMNVGIQGLGLYPYGCQPNADNQNWDLFILNNIFNCIQPCEQSFGILNPGVGILFPIYRLELTRIKNNCFLSTKNPVVIYDALCNSPGVYITCNTCIINNSRGASTSCLISGPNEDFIKSTNITPCYNCLTIIGNNESNCEYTGNFTPYNFNFPTHFGYTCSNYIREECLEAQENGDSD